MSRPRRPGKSGSAEDRQNRDDRSWTCLQPLTEDATLLSFNKLVECQERPALGGKIATGLGDDQRSEFGLPGLLDGESSKVNERDNPEHQCRQKKNAGRYVSERRR